MGRHQLKMDFIHCGRFRGGDPDFEVRAAGGSITLARQIAAERPVDWSPAAGERCGDLFIQVSVVRTEGVQISSQR